MSRNKAGFTLIELMTVLLIMMILFGIAAAAFVSMNKGQGMSASTRRAKGGMTIARQTAITKRANTQIWFFNDMEKIPPAGCYVISNYNSGLPIIGETNYLSAGITCSVPTNITFKTDGTCLADASEKLLLQLVGESRTNVLRVYQLTGIVRISELGDK